MTAHWSELVRWLIEEFLRASKSSALAEEGLPVASSFPMVDAGLVADEVSSWATGDTSLYLRLPLSSSSDMVASEFAMVKM